jgi:phosphohistidine phosphatase SixA
MMRLRGAFVLLLAAAAPAAGAGPACEPAALYLVRHAEKIEGSQDPDVELSERGRATAQALAAWLAPRGLDAIYVTHLRRTQQTALPVAAALDLEVRVLPAADTDRLLARLHQACGQRVLVVGHSNTVPAIAQAFGAEVFEIGEQEFGTVWERLDGSWKSQSLVVPAKAEIR